MFYTDDFMWYTLGVTELPDHLFHYTSIETLALILKNKTLRFTRLDGVNDPEEATAQDLKCASSLVFASCWTEEDRESLAMWKLYTRDMQGVRIRFPTDLFAGRHKPVVMDKGGSLLMFDGDVTINRKPPAFQSTLHYVSGPNKIYYTDDPSFRNPQCLYEEPDGIRIYLPDLGMVKNTYWAFEREWRYMIRAITPEMTYRRDAFVEHVLLDLASFPVMETAVFIPVDVSAFDQLEVLLGPRATVAEQVIVETLLVAHVPNATLRKSQINVR